MSRISNIWFFAHSIFYIGQVFAIACFKITSALALIVFIVTITLSKTRINRSKSQISLLTNREYLSCDKFLSKTVWKFWLSLHSTFPPIPEKFEREKLATKRQFEWMVIQKTGMIIKRKWKTQISIDDIFSNRKKEN